jgi:hypothetical protein
MPNPTLPRDSNTVTHPGLFSCDVENEVASRPDLKGRVQVFDFLTLNAYDRCTREIDNRFGHGLEEFAGYRDKHLLPHLGANINLIIKKKVNGEFAA